MVSNGVTSCMAEQDMQRHRRERQRLGRQEKSSLKEANTLSCEGLFRHPRGH